MTTAIQTRGLACSKTISWTEKTALQNVTQVRKTSPVIGVTAVPSVIYFKSKIHR